MNLFNPFKKTRVFISYRRRTAGDDLNPDKEGTGERVSKKLDYWLRAARPGMHVFYDKTPNTKNRLRGEYWMQIQDELRQATHAIILLHPDALTRCYEPDNEAEPNDVFGYEIRNALRQGCEIIPIFVGSDVIFRDKDGNKIKNNEYDRLPEKFRNEAKARKLLSLQRYNIKNEMCAPETNDESLNDRLNAIFSEKVLPPQNTASPFLLAAAVALAVGGFFVLKYRQEDAQPTSVGSVTVALAEVSPDDAAHKTEEGKAEQKASEHRKPEEELRRALDDAAEEFTKENMNLDELADAIRRIEAAVAQGANPNVSSKIDGQTPLHLATSAERLRDFARRLLDGGANPNVQDSWGDTPLHNAASNGDAECARLLLERGADKSLRNKSGETPADLAATNPELQQLLR